MKINESSSECCGTLIADLDPGAVVKLAKREGFWLVLSKPVTPPWKSRLSIPPGTALANLDDGERLYAPLHARGVHYPDASVCPGAPKAD